MQVIAIGTGDANYLFIPIYFGRDSKKLCLLYPGLAENGTIIESYHISFILLVLHHSVLSYERPKQIYRL